MFGIFDISSKLLAQLADVSLRALCLGLLALVAIRIVRSAASQHAVWTVVLAGMLALPVLAPLAPPLAMPVAIRQARPARWVVASGVAAAPRTSVHSVSPTAPPSVPAPPRWPMLVAAAYLAVALGFLTRFLVGYRFSRRLLSNCEIVREPRAINLLDDLACAESLPWPLPELRATSAVTVPMTIGWREPAILLPAEWQGWDDWKLRAVLAHELAHIRRGDWLAAVAASLNRCLFWFHPLAWWLERRLAALAEQASDEAALISSGDAPRYASVILEFAAALRSGGKRLALDSVAMARTPNVSHRINRILELRRPAPGILNKTTWTAIVVCALPLVYSAAALQLSQPAPRRITNPGLAQLLTEGSKLSAVEAQQIEQQLVRDPEDLDARARLMSYYVNNGREDASRNHTFWLIEHHPESEFANYWQAYLSSIQDSDRAKALWLAQVAAHPDDARVLAHAAVFVGQKDQFAQEDLLKRARQVDPSNPEWTKRLADLMSGSIARWILSKEWKYVPPTEPAFAEAAKTELETSTDASLVGTVGEFLASGPPGGLPPTRTQSDFAALLLQRAQSLDSDNAEWTAAIQRLRASRENLPATVAPAVSKGVPRIRVGAVVQQSNLLTSVHPIYPPLAQQARIQGVVRFNALIGKDGHVANVALISGHPLLVSAAEEAVKQWVYRPTLLNGDPIEVATVVDVQFTLPPEN